MTVIEQVDDVDEQLERYGHRIRAALFEAVPDGEPVTWLYDLVRDYPERPAKHIRPALCLATARAFGAVADEALGPAVAIELLHNAFLVHDDIADGSLLRRGHPTLHERHGVGLALNAGDALAVLAQRVLRQSLDRYRASLADLVAGEFETMMLRSLEGQATELGWRRDTVEELTPEDYLDLILHKTCWYTTVHPLRVGALIGSGGDADISSMIRFGFYLGAAFQIRDDLLNLVGDEATYGKEILGDLHEGKRTLMLIHLLGAARGSDRALVRRYLRADRDERSADLVATVRSMMDHYGSIDFATDYAAGIAGAALDAFEVAFTDARHDESYRFVRALVPYMLERNS